MSAQIETGVKRRLESPSKGVDMRLIVCADGSTDTASEKMQNVGATINADLGYGMFSITIEETDLDALCSIDEVSKVEIEGKGATLQSADF